MNTTRIILFTFGAMSIFAGVLMLLSLPWAMIVGGALLCITSAWPATGKQETGDRGQENPAPETPLKPNT